MPFVYDNLAKICLNKDYLISWLRKKELLGDFSEPCLKGYFTFRQDKSYSSDGVLWRFSHSKCTNKISIREDSWFSGTHLSLEQVIKLTYYWVYKLPLEFITRELKISEHTIVDWCQFARDVCIRIIKG